MTSDVRDLAEIDRTQVGEAGGKGANLGELTRIPGVRVPPGFCILTSALAGGGELAPAVARAITERVDAAGPDVAWAVRSSATAEDLPTASFAGQQDSFLGVVGAEAVIEHVRRCRDSLFTERAVAYRRSLGFGAGEAQMAVVVQQMVDPAASGVAFTADPVTGDRTVVAIESVAGLGDALMAGAVDPERTTVRAGVVHGSTALLTPARALELAAVARSIEAHLGAPQDIEWCLDGAGFAIVQARPITTLFPIPANAGDGVNHVYVSVGHQQMMTDPFTPFGLSLHQMIAGRPMVEAGGRLYVDLTMGLASPATRAGILDALGTSDPLIGGALQAVVDRDGFLPDAPADIPMGAPVVRDVPLLPADDAIVAQLIEETERSVAELAGSLAGRQGSDLFDAIAADVPELKRILTHPDSRPVIMSGIGAALWLNDHVLEWFGESNVIDLLTLSAPGNVTAEMGLALLDVADAIRPDDELVRCLRDGADDAFVAAIPSVAAFLRRYGMRCVGEIDITRPRWFEQPSALVPVILADVDGFEPGEAARRFAQGAAAADAKAAEILERVRALPDGEAKAAETEAMIARVRAFAGYREHPKYGYICRFGIYKRALLAEVDRLVDTGVLRQADDAWFLRFEELRDVVRAGVADHDLIERRRAQHLRNQALTPPRVLTSDGEAVPSSYGREAPEGALIGLAVSAGTVEGRARVARSMAEADVGPGDVLVTVGTDPSWSPLFVAIAALVTEVGGLMTHGAVVAREYGLPAVVGVEGATTRIRDGQRIRVHGADGVVELLDG